VQDHRAEREAVAADRTSVRREAPLSGEDDDEGAPGQQRLDRALADDASSEQYAAELDDVTRQSISSFPASDAPSWSSRRSPQQAAGEANH
jgi:hypothetical protein